jgi:hypothetical protein
VLSKRGTTLFLSMQRGDAVEHEQAVESPREAIDLAKRWRNQPPPTVRVATDSPKAAL